MPTKETSPQLDKKTDSKDKDGKAVKSGKTAEKSPKRFKPKARRRVVRGQVHIKCSYNNTMITITDLNGSVLGWATAGSLGFKGAKKATPYAATLVSTRAVENVAKTGLLEVDVFIKGVGAGREAAIRALGNNGLKVNSIKDVTPVPHNGCRPRKIRRV